MQKIYLLNIIMIGLFLFGSSLKGQTFIPPITPDETISGGISNVQNSGADWDYFDSDYFKVFVWDGTSPMIGWSANQNQQGTFPFSGAYNGVIEDPDVAVYVSGNNIYAFIAYLIHGDVWVEGHYYNSNTQVWTTSFSPTQITFTGDCSTPNVDVNDQNYLALVWQQGYDMKILYTDIYYTNANTFTLLYGNSKQIIKDPDVAVFSSPNTPHLCIAYNLDEIGIAENFRVDYIPTWNSTTLNNAFNYRIYDPDYFGKPRIACNKSSTGEYYEAVIAGNLNGSTEIIGYNIDNSSGFLNVTGPTILNMGLEPDYNARPCVDFAGGRIAVQWENESFNTNGIDIILSKLDISGNPITPDYYIVNVNNPNNQIIPAIAGLSNGNHDILLAYFDDDTQEFIYKVSDIYGSAVRKGKTNISAHIYPNPVKDYVYINNCSEGTYSIYDVSGKIVIKGNILAKNNKIDLRSLNTGVYFLKVSTSDELINQKLFIE